MILSKTRCARDEPSLGTAATSEWTTVELDLFDKIKTGHRQPGKRSIREESFLVAQLSHVLILHFACLMCSEWHYGKAIPVSMYTSEQAPTAATDIAWGVPLVVRQRFLDVFATMKSSGNYGMSPSNKESCHSHILIMYLLIHRQFDVGRDELSSAPLKANFTRLMATSGIRLATTGVHLSMAGCEVIATTKGHLTATLSLPLSFPPMALVKMTTLSIDWCASGSSETIQASQVAGADPRDLDGASVGVGGDRASNCSKRDTDSGTGTYKSFVNRSSQSPRV